MLHKNCFNFVLILGLSVLGTACGSQVPAAAAKPNVTYGTPLLSNNQLPYSLPSPLPASIPTNAVPAYTSDFKIYGAKAIGTAGGPSSVTLSNIQADSILKVAVVASSPGISSGNGYQAQFDCVKFSVKVGNSTQTAFLTTTNRDGTGVCQGARAKVTLDFSSQLTPGHGPMSIEVSDPYFDNCYNNNSFPNGTGFAFYNQGYATGYSYYGPYSFMYVCNMNQVPAYLSISGNLSVHTNGTL
jgi:hypothetical protein